MAMLNNQRVTHHNCAVFWVVQWKSWPVQWNHVDSMLFLILYIFQRVQLHDVP